MKQSEMQNVRKASVANQNRHVRQFMIAACAAIALICSAIGARADCGPTAGKKTAMIRMPILSTNAPIMAEEEQEKHKSIVGLWHARYTSSDGSPFIETLKEWHSDFTEFENVNHNPAIGSVCVGVWKQLSDGTVKLHHLGFLFTPEGVPSGTFIVDETDTLAGTGMSYEGVFVFRTYDVNGIFTGVKITGTIAAERITVS
jgi:hypothetical protein